jgi:O-acetyl-ADP-ribose deacetylase (regulator of RNase III)
VADTFAELVVAPRRVVALTVGDITRIPADVIVNAANERLAGGGGVDGAIHRAGGPAVMADLRRRYGETRFCPTGSAVVSDAGELPARWVVHAVGPIWRGGGHDEPALLESAYRTSMRLADVVGARTVTLPAISTGIYGYPRELAAPVALRAIREELQTGRSVERATVVLFSGDAFDDWARALEALRGE